MSDAPDEEIRLGDTVIRLFGPDYTETVIADLSVPAAPNGDPDQARLVHDLGYGDDIALMCREPEIAHTLIAHLLLDRPSPVLCGVALGSHVPQSWFEEGAAIALQRWARFLGVSLVDVARRLSRCENSLAHSPTSS